MTTNCWGPSSVYSLDPEQSPALMGADVPHPSDGYVSVGRNCWKKEYDVVTRSFRTSAPYFELISGVLLWSHMRMGRVSHVSLFGSGRARWFSPLQ